MHVFPPWVHIKLQEQIWDRFWKVCMQLPLDPARSECDEQPSMQSRDAFQVLTICWVDHRWSTEIYKKTEYWISGALV